MSLAQIMSVQKKNGFILRDEKTPMVIKSNETTGAVTAAILRPEDLVLFLKVCNDDGLNTIWTD